MIARPVNFFNPKKTVATRKTCPCRVTDEFSNNILNKKEVEIMPEKWTGKLIGKMHNAGVTYQELANEMGVTKPYVSMLLNSKRSPEGVQERMESAFRALLQKRNGESS